MRRQLHPLVKTPRLQKPVLALEAEEETLAAVGCTQNLIEAAAAAPTSSGSGKTSSSKSRRNRAAAAARARSRRTQQAGRQARRRASARKVAGKRGAQNKAAQQEEEKENKVQCARNHGVACRWRVAEVESTHARAHTLNARWRRRSK